MERELADLTERCRRLQAESARAQAVHAATQQMSDEDYARYEEQMTRATTEMERTIQLSKDHLRQTKNGRQVLAAQSALQPPDLPGYSPDESARLRGLTQMKANAILIPLPQILRESATRTQVDQWVRNCTGYAHNVGNTPEGMVSILRGRLASEIQNFVDMEIGADATWQELIEALHKFTGELDTSYETIQTKLYATKKKDGQTQAAFRAKLVTLLNEFKGGAELR